MTDSNDHSNPLGNFMPPVSPGEYLLNKAKIAEAKALISAYEDMNEAGKQSHDELARELEQKIREGEQARELLLRLGSQSTFQVPFQRPAIDYSSSTSRIEEVPNYDSSPPKRHSHQQAHYQQFQGNPNQQTHNFMPQVSVQPVASSSYHQQSNSPQQHQWIPENSNSGQSAHYSSYSPQHQPPIMQNRRSSYSHQRPLPYKTTNNTTSQLASALGPQPNASNLHSRPVAVTSPNHVSPIPIANLNGDRASVSNQNVTHGSHPSNPVSEKPIAYPNGDRSSVLNQNVTHGPHPLSHVPSSGGNPNGGQSNPYSTKPIANHNSDRTSVLNQNVGPHPLSHVPTTGNPNGGQSNPVSTKPIANPNSDRTSVLNQNVTHNPRPLSHLPTTGISNGGNSAQYSPYSQQSIRQNSSIYTQEPLPRRTSNTTSQLATALGPQPNVSNSNSRPVAVTSPNLVSTNQIANPNGDRTSVLNQNVTHGLRPLSHDPTTLPSVHENSSHIKSIHHIATPSTSLQNGSSASQIRVSVPPLSQSVPLNRPPPPSTGTIPYSAAVPKTPIRQLPTTIINGSPRSAKQADKKSLASHILFGLGKRRREPETVSTVSSSIEPQPKRQNTQQSNGLVMVDAGPPAATSYFVRGQATPAVQKPNVPNGLSTASSSLQQPLQQDSIPSTMPHETQQISPSLSASSGLVMADGGPPAATSYFVRGQAIPAVQKPNVPNGVSTASSSLQQPLQQYSIPPTMPRETQQISPSLSASSGDQQQPVSQQQPVNVAIPSTSKVAAAVTVPEVSKIYSVQNASTVPHASSTVVQASTLPSPVHLDVPVPVPSPLGSKETTQPVASTILEQPQPSTPAKLQFSFIGSGLGPITQPPQKNQQFSFIGSGLGPISQSPQKNQPPLFLPSPVSSPDVDAKDDDVSMSGPQQLANVISGLRRSAKRKNHAFVLAPRRPPYLVKYFQLEKQKIGKRSLSKSVAGEEDFYNSTPNISLSYAERQVVRLACSRLQELTCKWDGCLVKMNSVDTLIHHLNRRHKPRTSHSNFFLCRWTQCGRRCNFHEKHLEKHASLPLNCPYEDCEESFRSAPPLLKHTRADHENDELKPSTQLLYPKIKIPDAIPFGVMPSYLITTRVVNPDEIPSAWHAILAPRVLRDISGLERERSKNKGKKIVHPNGDIIIIPPDEEPGEYDFLNTRPTRYSSQPSRAVDLQLEDLNSADISRLVGDGLILWRKERSTERTPPDVEREFINTTRSEFEGVLLS